jgi:serine/threonine-protein kinase
MGEVYLAYDYRLATDVALKRIPLELALEESIRGALIREAQILARLSDTHIVRLFDLADTPDGIFLVLEYVCGPSLDKYLATRKTLTQAELSHVMRQVGSALGRAHGMGIVHRDLKPANLLVALKGEEQLHYLESGALPATLLHAEVKVADFGLAKVILQSRVEASGRISGTPAYMAPEQFRGELPGPETDIYSLGYVAYRCLAGSVPLGDANPMYFHLHMSPPPIEGVAFNINAAIQKAISKERRDRFPTVAEFVDALLKPFPSRTAAPPPDPPRSAPPPPPNPPPPKPPPPDPPRPRFKATTFAKPDSNRQFVKSLPMLLLVLGIIGLASGGVRLVWWLAHNAAAAETTYGPAAGSTASPAESDAQPQPIPPNPAPPIDEPPPVIEAARGPAPNAPPPGIDHPTQLAKLTVPGTDAFGFGPDGTLYVTQSKTLIGAVRDGKLVWQFKMGGDYGKFKISPNGLIWFLSEQGGGRLFCFNAAGQGGEFRDYTAKQKYLAAFNALPEPVRPAQCEAANEQHHQPVALRYSSTGKVLWKTDLDQDCRTPLLTGPAGETALQTDAGTVYMLSAAGAIHWTFSPPCQLDSDMRLLPGGELLVLCSDRHRIVGLRDGKQQFALESKQPLSLPFGVDSAGSFYRFASNGKLMGNLIIKTDSSGRDLWSLPVDGYLGVSAFLAPDRKLYVLGWVGNIRDALVFAEAPK